MWIEWKSLSGKIWVFLIGGNLETIAMVRCGISIDAFGRELGMSRAVSFGRRWTDRQNWLACHPLRRRGLIVSTASSTDKWILNFFQLASTLAKKWYHFTSIKSNGGIRLKSWAGPTTKRISIRPWEINYSKEIFKYLLWYTIVKSGVKK